MKNTSLRAVGYKRVSMKEQVDGHSLDAQEANIRQYAENQEWQLTKFYTDAGISAKKGSHRPALEMLLNDAQAGLFDIVIVDKIDRFYRHLSSLLTALEKLNSWQVSFASVQERLDFTTVWGKLTLTVLGTLAEIYIDNLRQETRKGKKQRARNGLWNGNIPYGYCRGNCSSCKEANGVNYCPNFGSKDIDNDPRQLILHPVESQVVRHIYQLYLEENISDARIARRIQELEISLPNGKIVLPRTKGIPNRYAPGPFKKDYVRTILTNIFYTGIVAYAAQAKKRDRNSHLLFPGRHPAIISPEKFEATQELRKLLVRTRQFKHGHPSRVYPLTGILYCGYCGSPFRGSTARETKYYRDSSRIDHYGNCQQKSLKATEIESRIAVWLEKKLSVPGLEDELNIQAELVIKLQDRYTRAKELYLSGELNRESFQTEKQHYESLITPLQKKKTSVTIALLKNTQSQLAVWKNLSNTKRKRLLQLSLEAVFVRDNALVAIQPTVALLPLLGEGCKSGPDGI